MKDLSSLLIKPAGPDCNLACDYCFYADKAGLFPESAVHRMSEDILERLIKQALTQASGPVTFGWQGGEPTLMGLPFYHRAIEFQEAAGPGWAHNGLQTNGLLLDERWARFLARESFLVGLSLDGPEHVHDRYRKNRAGLGSFAKVRDRARLLLDHAVQTNALIVVNDYSVRFPDEIYAFHKELGLPHMQFIPCVEPDPAFACPGEAYGKFLIRLFDLWRADFRGGRPTTFIRFFDSVFFHYAGLPPPDCTLLPECGNYLVVEHDGGVYSCDFFVDPAHRLGDLHHDRLSDLLNSPAQLAFGRAKARLPQNCRQCRWLPYCQGGCPQERSANGPDKPANRLCLSYRMFFEHAHPHFLALAQKWRDEREKSAGPGPGPAVIKPGRNDPCPCGSGRKHKKCCGK